MGSEMCIRDSSISVNRKGADNRVMILQALSSLISHRVPVNLDPLFPDLPAKPEKQLLQTINLGGIPIQQIFAKGVEGLNLRTDEQPETYLKPQPVSAPFHAGARYLRYTDESEIKRQSSESLMHSQRLMAVSYTHLTLPTKA